MTGPSHGDGDGPATTFTSPDLGASDVAAALAGAGFEVAPPRPLRRTRLDTFDGRLRHAGLRLALDEGPERELVLSGPGPVQARLTVEGAPRFAGDLPPGPFRARLANLLDVRALLPLATVTARQTWAVQRDGAGAALVRLSLQDRIVVDGHRSPPVWAVELVELTGYPRAAASARRLLGDLGLHGYHGTSLDLAASAAGVDLAPFVGSPTVALGPDEPALAAFRRVLANLVVAIDANWQGTVEATDPEFLHDLRVAVRRTRSVLAQSKRVLPDAVRATYRESFGWLGTVTSPARDLDVYVIEWGDYVGPLGPAAATALEPVVAHLAERREEQHATLATVLQSDRYAEVMAAWRAWLDDPASGGEGEGGKQAARPVGRVAAGRIGAAQAQLLARGRGIGPATPAEELHELRKDAKKLRYLLECFGGLLPAAPRKAFVSRLKALQDNLGEHQDTEVHVAQLRHFSHELHAKKAVGPDAFLAMGQLTEHLERRRLAARQEFAERFAAYDTKKTAATLADLLKAARP